MSMEHIIFLGAALSALMVYAFWLLFRRPREIKTLLWAFQNGYENSED